LCLIDGQQEYRLNPTSRYTRTLYINLVGLGML